MQIKIIIEPEELKGKDSGFSLGYLSVEDHESAFTLFKKRKCMILADLYLLLEALERLRTTTSKEDKWVGTSNGASFKLIKRDENLIFKHASMHCTVDFADFYSSLKTSISDFLVYWKSINKNCVSESCYIDLYTFFKN